MAAQQSELYSKTTSKTLKMLQSSKFHRKVTYQEKQTLP